MYSVISCVFNPGDIDLYEYFRNNDYTLLYHKNDIDNVMFLKWLESTIMNYSLVGSNEDIVKMAKSQIYDSFSVNPYMYFDSYIFDSEYQVYIFSFFERAKIKRMMAKLDRDADYYLQNGTENKYQKMFLFNYLSYHINLDDNYQRKLVNEILKNNHLDDIYEKKFLFSYVGKWMLKECGFEDLNVPIFVCDIYDNRIGMARNNYIFIKNNVDDDSVFSQIVTICHEIQHVIQHELLAKKYYYGDDDEALVAFQALERVIFGGDFYNENYYFSRIELDAEEKGLNYALRFVNSFGKGFLYENIKNDFKSASYYDFTRIPVCADDYEKEFAEYAYSTMWDSVVSESLIDKNRILLNVYSDKAERRPFEELITQDLSSKSTFYILYNFLFCDIQMGILDDIDINSFNNEKLVLDNLFIIYDKVIKKLHDLREFKNDELYEISDMVDLADFEIEDIYTSEVIYYVSFLTKLSKFLVNNCLQRVDQDRLIKKMGNIVDYVDYFSNTDIRGLNKDSSDKFLANSFNELMVFYNNLRKEEIVKHFKGVFEKIVPLKYRSILINFGGVNYKLDNFVFNVLPQFVSLKDINVIVIDGVRIDLDKYLLKLISNSLNLDSSELLILIDLLKINFEDTSFRDDVVRSFNKIIASYDTSYSCYSELLNNCMSYANDYYEENKFVNTPVCLDLTNFSEDVRCVINNCR